MDPIDFLAWIGRHGTGVFTFVVVLAAIKFASDVALIAMRAVERRRRRS